MCDYYIISFICLFEGLDIMLTFDDAEMFLIGIGDEFEENENALDAYNKLYNLLEGKNYFIVSLCLDDQIYSSRLDESRIVTPLGGKRKKQCPDACVNELFDNAEQFCPHCGKELIYNNILAENYVEEGYLPQWNKHKLWLTGTLNKKLLVLELGCSMKFPQIIRFPFEKITSINEKSYMIRVNEKLPMIGTEISKRAEGVKQSSVEWLKLV